MKKVFIKTLLYVLFLGCGTGEYPKNLGSKYSIDYDGNSLITIYENGNIVAINGDVTAYKYDDIFIVVQQKPVWRIKDSMSNDPLREYRFTDYERAIAESRHFDYWIIDKRADSVIGPLTPKAYDSIHPIMGIPDSLRVN